MGSNVAAGETRMLLVGTGVWKMSRLLVEDRGKATTQHERDCTYCLITEVVVPGFHWEDHQYMKIEQLKELFRSGEEGARRIEELSAFIKNDDM